MDFWLKTSKSYVFAPKIVLFMLFICYHFEKLTEFWSSTEDCRSLGILLDSIFLPFFNSEATFGYWVWPRNVLHVMETLSWTNIKWTDEKRLKAAICFGNPIITATFPWNASERHYFSTERRYLPLFCYELCCCEHFPLFLPHICKNVGQNFNPGRLVMAVAIPKA